MNYPRGTDDEPAPASFPPMDADAIRAEYLEMVASISDEYLAAVADARQKYRAELLAAGICYRRELQRVSVVLTRQLTGEETDRAWEA